MADHDDNTPPDRSLRDPFYPQDRRYVTERELTERDQRLHVVSNRVHAQDAKVAVHEQRINDHARTLADQGEELRELERRKNEEHAAIRRELEDKTADARKYAHAIVAQLKTELVEMHREAERKRQQEATAAEQKRQQETNSAIARTAIWVSVACAVFGGGISIAVALIK